MEAFQNINPLIKSLNTLCFDIFVSNYKLSKYIGLIIMIWTLSTHLCLAQNVGIGTTTPHESAMLDVVSSDKGIILPRVTESTRPLNPATGLMIYQTDAKSGLYLFDGMQWKLILAGTVTLPDSSIVSPYKISHKTVAKSMNVGGVSNNGILYAVNDEIASDRNLLSFLAAPQRLGVNRANPETSLHVHNLGGTRVSTTNPGFGTTDWIAGSFGGQQGDRVAMGIYNRFPTIAGMNASQSTFTTLAIQPQGRVFMPLVNNLVGDKLLAPSNTGLINGRVFYGFSNGLKTSNNVISLGGALDQPTIFSLDNKNFTFSNTLGSVMTINGLTRKINIPTLAGSGVRAVVANSQGIFSTTSIASFADNMGNHSATQNLKIGTFHIVNSSSVALPGFTINNGGYVGILNTSALARLMLDGINSPTSGASNWITGNFGANAGNRVVIGLLNGKATVGAHNNALNAWAPLNLHGTNVKMPSVGVTNRYLVANASGQLMTSTIGVGIANVSTAGYLSNGDFSYFNSKLPGQPNASPSLSGKLSNVDWISFNDKVPTSRSVTTLLPLQGGGNLSTDQTLSIPKADAMTSGYLSSTDWNTFNNKQGVEPNAGSSNNGFLSVQDFNAFNAKLALPTLSNGSIAVSTGTTLMNAPGAFHFDQTNHRLGIGTATPGTKMEVIGTQGLSSSSSNSGTGYTDWIAVNAGEISSDRIVMGTLNGSATVGAHNTSLNAWKPISINPLGHLIMLGADKTVPNPHFTTMDNTANRPVIVNGSIRQSYYTVPISIGPGADYDLTWTHNLGYGPILMMSTDQNGVPTAMGTANNMDYVTFTTYNNNTNQTVFRLHNHNGSAAAIGNFRWILVQ
jgi:hypothetical protein